MENTKKTGNKIFLVHSIGTKMIAAFMVPVILIILLGIISYSQASKAITETYEENLTSNINTAASYICLGMQQIEEEAEQIVASNDFYKYYRGAYKNNHARDYMLWSSLYNSTVSTTGASDFINTITVIGSYGDAISSAGSLGDGFYDTFHESLTDSQKEKAQDGIWIGKHTTLDDKLLINPEKYAATYIRSFNNVNGYVILDINTAAILDVLNNLEMDDGFYIGFVSADGRELLSGTKEQAVFAEQKFYQQAVEQNKSVSKNVTYKGQKYIFVYAPIKNSSAAVACLLPKSAMEAQVAGIRNFTIIVVIISILIAGIIGVIMSIGIRNVIQRITKVLERATKGDFTAKIRSGRKDEFSILSNSINNMIDNMKVLVDKMDSMSSVVADTSTEVSDSSKVFVNSTNEIYNAITDIESGVMSQAEEARNCLNQMSELADKINVLYEHTNSSKKISSDTREYIRKGIVIIDELNEKSKATGKVTSSIIEGMYALEEQSKSIGSIIEVISSIADQTSLLSLNASIEAARAGESGKGFAVVADEIRKLAEESMNAVEKISEIIERISEQTNQTVQTAQQAESIVNSQQDALSSTTDVFNGINTYVLDLATSMDTIAMGVQKIEEAKNLTLHSVENISSVSEQSASATNEVTATITDQLEAAKQMDATSSTLQENSKELLDAMEQFTV